MEQSIMNKRVIEEYKSTKPSGFDRKADLAYWAARATENSDAHKHRATGGPDMPPKLHDTGEGPRSK
jgi:hypothetical protein